MACPTVFLPGPSLISPQWWKSGKPTAQGAMSHFLAGDVSKWCTAFGANRNAIFVTHVRPTATMHMSAQVCSIRTIPTESEATEIALFCCLLLACCSDSFRIVALCDQN